jgi:hypothetical protein
LDVVPIVVKCLNAAGQTVIEVYAASSAGASAGALIFGGEFVPGVNLALFANTLYNGYVAINNYEYVQQSILYCTGDRATAPTAPNVSGPDLPLPPLPPIFPGPAPLPAP